MLKHILITLSCLLISLSSIGQSLSDQTTQLFEKFKKATRFDYNYPREKVYLHFNSSSYLQNDTIWYYCCPVKLFQTK